MRAVRAGIVLSLAFCSAARAPDGGGKRGFLIGAGAGTVLVHQVAQALSEGNSDGPGVLLASAALGSILGGPAGALIGNSIDPPAIRWVPLWR